MKDTTDLPGVVRRAAELLLAQSSGTDSPQALAADALVDWARWILARYRRAEAAAVWGDDWIEHVPSDDLDLADRPEPRPLP